MATRAIICRTLGELREPKARDVLIKSVSSSEAVVKIEACRALGKVGRSEDATVLAQIMALDNLEDARIAAIDSGLTQLDKVEPPARDAARFSVFLGRLRRLRAFARAGAPQIELLYKQQQKVMPSHASDYGARSGMHRFEQLARRITALERPAQSDVRLADADARALHLPACAAGANGG